jgi:hypothetical protein
MIRALGIVHWALGIAATLLVAGVAGAQDMPDPSLIHGRAIPASELGDGVVTVRVVREAIGNNIAGQQVELTVAGGARKATTDEQGRAESRGLLGRLNARNWQRQRPPLNRPSKVSSSLAATRGS